MPRPDLAIHCETFDFECHIPLDIVLPEILNDPCLFGFLLVDLLQAVANRPRPNKVYFASNFDTASGGSGLARW